MNPYDERMVEPLYGGLTRSGKPRRKLWAPRVKTGCAACRKRKVKCDEAKPSCRNCIRATIQCPGFLSDKINTPHWQFCIPAVPCSTPQLDGIHEMRDVLALLPKVNSVAPAPNDDACRLMRVLIQGFMGDIPPRLGHSPAILAATRCFAGVLREIWQHIETGEKDTMPTSLMSIRTRSRYATALSALSDSLNDPLHSTTMETLIAAQLLCCFETFQDTCFETAARHMFGISRIFEHMGPRRFTTRYEIDMLIGQLPSLVCASYMFNMPCLLSYRGWDEILRREEHSSTGQRKYEIGAYRKVGVIYTLFAEATSFIEDSHNGQYDPVRHVSLQETARHARQKYMKWHFGWMDDLSSTVSDLDTISFIEECHRNPSKQWAAQWVGMSQSETLMHLRLPVALGCDDALKLEEQAQAFAKKLLQHYERYKDDPTFTKPQVATLIATKIAETADEWRQFAGEAEDARSAGQRCLVPDKIWKRWLNMMYIGVQRPS